MHPSSLLTAARYQRQKKDSQSEIAYRLLKEKIVRLEFPPASLLNEAQLMEELKLGRTPIREALQRLAFENLVVILPRRGTIVADLNMSDFQKIFEIRLQLEPYAARLATVRATPDEIMAMEALFEDADDILQQGDHHELIRLDHQAHAMLAQAAHNEFLAEILDQLYTHILRLWYVSLHKVSRLDEAIREHRDIIAAVKAGDADLAARIMHQHITGFKQEFEAAL
ncbi:MAG: GntR family transcriptional regulator [Chloroflexi bacterium]|nr:MAG: GntR family transcriptional regulator [Chloroflexota bacterium]